MLFTASWGNTTILIWSRWEGVSLWFFLCLLLKSENALPLLTPQPREGSPQNRIPLHKPETTHSREVFVVYSRAAQPGGIPEMERALPDFPLHYLHAPVRSP